MKVPLQSRNGSGFSRVVTIDDVNEQANLAAVTDANGYSLYATLELGSESPSIGQMWRIVRHQEHWVFNERIYGPEEIKVFGGGAGGGGSISWQGAWDNGTAYATDDLVQFGGASYVALVATTPGNDPAATPAEWDLVAAKGVDGTNGTNGTNGADGADGAPGAQGDPGIVWRGAWGGGLSYPVDDAVQYDGAAWIATAPTTPGNDPVTNTPNQWSQLVAKGVDAPPVNSHIETIGDGVALTYVVNHAFSTTDVIVQVHDIAAVPPEVAQAGVEFTDVDNVTITFTAAPATDSHKVVILSGGNDTNLGSQISALQTQVDAKASLGLVIALGG